jgi:hypothetical protein
MTPRQQASLLRLIEVARGDSGQSRRCADFLLAWWNARTCGAWDPTDLWSVDQDLSQSMLDVLTLIRERHSYPDSLGLKAEFEELVRLWRPQLVAGTDVADVD